MLYGAARVRDHPWPGRHRGACVAGVIYKVVETSEVSDVELEKILNEWTAEGWTLDSVQFAMRDSSKRPAMAFVTFTRPADPEG